MKPKAEITIVCTTIFEPEFLRGYLTEIGAADAVDRVRMIIVPDRKTPTSVQTAAHRAQSDGFRVECPSLPDQAAFLSRVGAPERFIPWDSDNRRNVGFLMALEQGCDILVSIDDDNYCLPDSKFINRHETVGAVTNENLVQSTDGWFNLCSLLQGPGEAVFPRGFPYSAQQRDRSITLTKSEVPLRIAMNAGLWLDEPDVDAIYRLCRRPKITGFSGTSVLLGSEVWSPINTQNTALTREAALTYYYVRMGFPLKGMKIDRFGDILSGYLTQKCVKHIGEAIRIGTPIVDHRRTPHNLFKDLYHELAGIVLLEEFVPWLIEEPLEGTAYLDVYESLAEHIIQQASRFSGFIWNDGGQDFLRDMANSMRIWTRLARSMSRG